MFKRQRNFVDLFIQLWKEKKLQEAYKRKEEKILKV